MAQHDYNIANQSGASFRQDLNNALSAIVTLNSGAASPSTTFAYQLWADTTAGTLKIRNAANNAWITLAELDGTLTMELGSAGSPGLYFRGDTNTGFFSANADELAIATGGIQRLIIDSSGRVLLGPGAAGRAVGGAVVAQLGIETLGQAMSLVRNSADTSGAIIALGKSRATAAGGITAVEDGDILGELRFCGANGADLANIGAHIRAIVDGEVGTAGDITDLPTRLAFSTTPNGEASAAERLRISPSGTIFCGNGETAASPANSTIAGTGGSGTDITGATLTIQGGRGTGTGAGGPIVFSTAAAGTTGTTLNAASERGRWDSSGRLLIGATSAVTTTAGHLVQGASADGFNVIMARDDSTTAAGNLLGGIRFYGNDGGSYEQCAAITAEADLDHGSGDKPTRLVFSATADGASTPTERMRISSTGQFDNFSSSASTAVFRSDKAAGTSENILVGVYGATGVADGTSSFAVRTNGNVLNTNNSYGAISDIKLKENVVDASSQWGDLKALQVRKYNFKEGQTHTQIGLIAQEVELVSPGLVSESPDRDEEGNDLGTVTKNVNYSVLYMKAVKALQEAMERIETLEAKVAALEAV